MNNATAPTAAQTRRLVVINDSTIDRAEIRRLLQHGFERQYEFVEVETGAAGVRTVLDADELPNCVVLAYNLPDMDAVDVLAALTGPDGLTACPVVVLSGTVGYMETRALLRAGAQECVGEGLLSPENLTFVVENAVERWAMARELREQQAALKTSEERLRLAIVGSELGTWHWDIRTGALDWSERCLKIFGIPPRTAMSYEKFLRALHPEDCERVDAAVQHALKNGSEYRIEFRIVWSDGSLHWAVSLGRAYYDAAGVPTRMEGIALDITELKRAEGARDENERNFRALAIASSEVTYRMSADWSTMLPLDGRQWVANSDQLLADWAWLDKNVPPDEHPRVRKAICEAIAQRTFFELEHRVTRPDGSIGWAFSRAVPILDENDALTAWFDAASDITDRKRAEEALRESESRFAVALKNSRIIVYTTDADLRYTWVHNPHQAFNSADILGRRDDELLSPEQAAPLIAIKRKVLNDGVGRRAEFTVEINGDLTVYDLTVEPLRDGTGNVVGLTVAAMDISDRIREESRLKVSEFRHRRLFETAKDGILILDAQAATITDANPFIAETLSYTQDELVGKELWQIGLFKDVEASNAAIRELGEKGYIRYDDLPLETKTGRRINVEFVSNLYGENGETVIQCNIRDITKRRETERALEKALAYTGDIIATLREPFVVLDGDLRVMTANRSFYESFHVTKDETENQFVYDLGNGQWDIPSLRTLLDQVLSINESVHDFEVEHTFPALGRKTMLLNARPFPPDCKTPELILLAVEDISADRERADELAEANRRKDEFLATLAHELRNPLAPIRNGLQILNLPQADAGTVEKTRSMMERQLEQMTRLIDDLMDLSRINQGRIVLQKTRMLVADAVLNAIDTSQPLIDLQRHELVVDMPPEPIYLEGDLTRISQVFANLLNNSAKYTDRGGRIRLAVERHGNDAVVSVTDNGLGIRADMLAHVFDMFAQIESSLEKSQGGLGIGLNIVKRLVEMHGGSINAESGGPGMGSMFTVRLPALLPVADEKPDDQSNDDKTKTAGCRRILVVDDNLDGAYTLAMVLKINGHDAQTAHDGLEAVEVSEAFKPEVILMDIGMPKLNGYDACRRICKQPWADGIMIVALTGWGQQEARQKSKDAGFNGHLVKPVDHSALMKLLANS